MPDSVHPTFEFEIGASAGVDEPGQKQRIALDGGESCIASRGGNDVLACEPFKKLWPVSAAGVAKMFLPTADCVCDVRPIVANLPPKQIFQQWYAVPMR